MVLLGGIEASSKLLLNGAFPMPFWASHPKDSN